MREVDKLIIHCSGTRVGVKVTVEDIRGWHKKRGFKDIGYHYVIYQDGYIAIGRALVQAGAHCKGYNKKSIGICYIGGLDKNGKFADTRTDTQKEELIWLVAYLKRRYPGVTVHGHNEFSNKACPGFDVQKEFI